MATVNTDTIEIKVSELLRDDQPNAAILDADTITQLIDIIQELVGDKRVMSFLKDLNATKHELEEVTGTNDQLFVKGQAK